MAYTWTVRTDHTRIEDYTDHTVGARALFAMLNTSTDVIEVKRMWLDFNGGMQPAVPGLQAGAAGTYVVQGISALSGGSALTVVKHDTASAALPAQVKLVRRPATVTPTNIFMRHGDTPGIPFYTGLMGNLFGSRSVNFASLFDFALDSQPLVLREGEGIMLYTDPNTVPHTQWLQFGFRNQASGATYWVHTEEMETGGPNEPVLGIFNGSGSGVVLELFAIDLIDVGQTSWLAGTGTVSSIINATNFRLAAIDGITNGEALTPVARDTQNPALPAGLILVKNSENVSVASRGKQVQWAHNMSSAGTVQQVGAIRVYAYPAQNVTGMGLGRYDWPIWNTGDNNSGLMLRKNEGIAIAVPVDKVLIPNFAAQYPDQWPSSFYNFDIVCEFAHTPAVVGGAEATYLAGVM